MFIWVHSHSISLYALQRWKRADCLGYDKLEWFNFQNHQLYTDMLLWKVWELVNSNNRKQSVLLSDECIAEEGVN